MAQQYLQNQLPVEAIYFDGWQSYQEIFKWLKVTSLFVQKNMDSPYRRPEEVDSVGDARVGSPEFLVIRSAYRSWRVDIGSWIVQDLATGVVADFTPVLFDKTFTIYEPQMNHFALPEDRRYQEKMPHVPALQHDGTEESAKKLVNWLKEKYDASVLPAGSFNNDPHTYYVAIAVNRGFRHLGSGDWIVRDYYQDFQFYKDREFKKKYEEVM